jgi:hypothetical protein
MPINWSRDKQNMDSHTNRYYLVKYWVKLQPWVNFENIMWSERSQMQSTSFWRDENILELDNVTIVQC